MMRIKGLGGKKLAILWKNVKIYSIDALLEACKTNLLTKLPGFGTKTKQNILQAIESYRSSQHRFHYATVADIASQLVKSLQKIFKTKLICLCGEIRRQVTTVKKIEMIAAVPSKKFDKNALRKLIIIHSSDAGETKAHTLDEIPVIIYHTPAKNFYYKLFKKNRQ